MGSDVSFDPYDPSLVDDPYPVYAALREHAPVYHGESRNFWALSRFDDVKSALADHDTYCSSQGLLVLEATSAYEAPSFPPGNLLLMDPPEHTAYRALVSRRFLQRSVAVLERRVADAADALIDRFIQRGSADVVGEFTIALPAIVFSDLLGIPKVDWERFQQWSAQLVSPAPTPEAMAAHHRAAEEVSAYFARLRADKQVRPGDDLLSEMAEGTVDGAPLGEAEYVGFAIAMLIAGNDTTSNALANGCYLLGTHPDQQAALRAEPELMGRAVEEVLRFEPSVHGLARTLTRDVELHGCKMRRGEKVLLLFASANRDEREFVHGGRFDVRRGTDNHLSFGFGIHYCVGIHLARLEARIGLSRLLARVGDYQLAGPARWRQLIPTRPMASLPIEFAPGRLAM